MINRLALFTSESLNPHRNLATEQVLLESVTDQCILYLWQNENTVVIGRNQNPWKECRTTLLEQEGGHLARRLSGGGAVFHDLGNLNFTFLMPQPDFDTDRQLSVILDALNRLGIAAEKSGRNDILAEGRKFSGNAFYRNGTQAYHHGTLLVDADMEKLGRYLSPGKAKLQSKGVDSVRSRVVNLKALNPTITVESLKAALAESFGAVYGLPVEILTESDLERDKLLALTDRNRSWEWNFGHRMPFTFSCEDRFPWGGVQIQLQVENGIIQCAKVYSDDMDWAWVPPLEKQLTGCRFRRDSIAQSLAGLGTAPAEDILRLLEIHLP